MGLPVVKMQVNGPLNWCEMCRFHCFRRNLDFYQSSHLSAMTAVDADSSNGELTIDLPSQTGPLIKGSSSSFG